MRPTQTPTSASPSLSRSATRSRWLLGAALVATLLAAFWPAADEGDAADGLQPVRRGAALQATLPQTGARGASAAPAGLLRTPSHRLPDRSPYANAAVLRDPFAVPAAPPVAASAPPAAAAPLRAEVPPPPTLPWQFGGRLQVPEQPDAVLLNDGNRTLSVAVGQALEGWRLDADRGDRLEFTHLASGQHLALALTP